VINLVFVIMSTIFVSIPLEARRINPSSISEFVQQYPQTKWIKCIQNYAFDYLPFPLYQNYSEIICPSKGYHQDISVLEIPNGIVRIQPINLERNWSIVAVNDVFIKEGQIKELFLEAFDVDELKDVSKITGKVAIIHHIAPCVYGHFIFDLLGQLALLEINNIEYDYVCIPYSTQVMKDVLEIWGIDRSKIIPLNVNSGISFCADTIILPTSIGEANVFLQRKTFYYPDFLMKYVHDKMLSNIKSLHEQNSFSEKIFISRKNESRAVLNEDEIFALFEPLGFKRYDLRSLSVEQQITLFYKAKTIVSFVGSGSTNVLFCRPGTHYVEISQSMVDSTFFYISQIFGLKYSAIDATSYHDLLYGNAFSLGRELPLEIVQTFIKDHYFEL